MEEANWRKHIGYDEEIHAEKKTIWVRLERFSTVWEWVLMSGEEIEEQEMNGYKFTPMKYTGKAPTTCPIRRTR